MLKMLLRPPSLLAYGIIIIATLAAGFFWWQQAIKPADLTSDQVETFIIPRNQSIDAISQSLYESGLIRSPAAFKLMVRRLDIAQNIQAGSFQLSPAQNTEEIALALTKGTSDIWVTFLEGWRHEEYAQYLEETFATRNVDFNAQEFIAATDDQEGYLFPDTYLVPLTISPEDMGALLRRTFDQKIAPLEDQIAASPYTLDQIVTMASLIEREANTDEARRMVAGVLWKRYQDNWPLQVDATMQYVVGYNAAQDDWWAPPTAAQKELDSPYNTYQVVGLPPGPIANPSLSSIQAALNPADNPYYYYITGNDGRMYYAETLEGHNQNIQNHLR